MKSLPSLQIDRIRGSEITENSLGHTCQDKTMNPDEKMLKMIKKKALFLGHFDHKNPIFSIKANSKAYPHYRLIE